MTVILKDEVRCARKGYNCDASSWWNRCYMRAEDCTPDQLLSLQGAEADQWKIRRGQRYRYVRGVNDGRMFTWRERLDMGSLCAQHNLYDEY